MLQEKHVQWSTISKVEVKMKKIKSALHMMRQSCTGREE